jgi:biopolymer transport protein ExbD
MAEKRRELDVWLLQANTVYRKVPYTVVTDWVQEGRLLAEDKVRAAGGDKWHEIGKVPSLAAFLPRAEPFRVEDKAEALEPVEVGFDWKKGHGGDEEEDVDMIPLIDISLVLLIFFMMTAAVSSGLFSPINTPPADRQLEVIAEGKHWVGINIKDATGRVERGSDGQPVPWYSLGKGNTTVELRPDAGLTKEERHLTQDPVQVADGLVKELKELQGDVEIHIKADQTLQVEVVRAMINRLQDAEAQINRARTAQAKVRLDIRGVVSDQQGRRGNTLRR